MRSVVVVRCVCDVHEKVYADQIRKRTNMNVDTSLLARAARILGTRGTTGAVHAAMEEVVNGTDGRGSQPAIC